MAHMIKVQVEGHDEPIEVAITLDQDRLKMSELITVEEVLGGERYDEVEKGVGVSRPSVIRAIIYSQLKTQYPDARLEDFDFDLSALTALAEDEGGEDETGKDEGGSAPLRSA